MKYLFILFHSMFNLWWLSGYSIWLAKRVRGELSGGMHWRVIRWIYHEIKPFVITLIVLSTIFSPYNFTMKIIDALLNLGLWWMLKDVDKDDRWKRRLAKAKEKIQITGSKLVVVAGN